MASSYINKFHLTKLVMKAHKAPEERYPIQNHPVIKGTTLISNF